MLLRSKQTPLRIRYVQREKSSYSSEKCSLELVLAHTARIQELQLRLSPFLLKDVLPTGLLPSPAPLLQALTIQVSGHSERSIRLVTFSNGVASALRHLQLIRCSISPPIPVFDRLTTLTLHRLLGLLTIDDLQDILTSAQSLVHLIIYFSIRSDTPPASDPANTIRLSHLSRLLIHGSLFTTIHVLTCLDIPLQANVRISCFATETTPVEWVPFSEFLKNRFSMVRDDSSIRIRTLTVNIALPSDFITTFSASDNHGHPNLQDWNDSDVVVDPLRIACKYPGQHVSRDLINIIHDAHASGFLAGLRNTRVRFDASRTETTTPHACFENVFGAIPELRYIEVTKAGLIMRCLCAYLSLTPHHPAVGNASVEEFSGPTFAPVLEELVISETKFMPPADGGQDMASISDLYEALAMRKEKGLGLRRLVLNDCDHVLEEVVDQLKNVVSEVVWLVRPNILW